MTVEVCDICNEWCKPHHCVIPNILEGSVYFGEIDLCDKCARDLAEVIEPKCLEMRFSRMIGKKEVLK